MTDKTDGQVAYEAAAKLTKCSQPWSEANKCKWEEAARAVKKSFVEQACEAVDEWGKKYSDFPLTLVQELKQAIRDKF